MDMGGCLCSGFGYDYKTIAVYIKDNKYQIGMLTWHQLVKLLMWY